MLNVTKILFKTFSFKQSHPNVFQDPCLYSSVCDILSNSACRVTARRFIQELFLDVSFLKVSHLYLKTGFFPSSNLITKLTNCFIYFIWFIGKIVRVKVINYI